MGKVVETVQVNLCLPLHYMALCEPLVCAFCPGNGGQNVHLRTCCGEGGRVKIAMTSR